MHFGFRHIVLLVYQAVQGARPWRQLSIMLGAQQKARRIAGL